MNDWKLYMILLGCKPEDRLTEQHDIFFGIASDLPSLKPDMRHFWPEAPRIHIDAWREVNVVNGYRIEVVERNGSLPKEQQLFFINLGGYKQNEFDEFHYKMLIVAPDASTAIRTSKESAFFKHTGFEGAVSHVDDKYGVDVDDVYNIEDILFESYKDRFALKITRTDTAETDALHLGYLKWEKIGG